MDDARPAWVDDEWLDFLLGVDRAARATLATFDAAAWDAPPMAGAAPAADDLVHALLGLDHLARRVVALGDRCADVPAPPPPPPSPPLGGILR